MSASHLRARGAESQYFVVRYSHCPAMRAQLLGSALHGLILGLGVHSSRGWLGIGRSGQERNGVHQSADLAGVHCAASTASDLVAAGADISESGRDRFAVSVIAEVDQAGSGVQNVDFIVRAEFG